MKFLPLTAALTLFASPAAAVDYVKCEAIQKAAARIRISRDSAADTAGDAYESAAKEKACGPYTGSSSYLKCEIEFLKISRWDEIKAVREKATREFDERLAKVQADYQAEGCY